MEERKGFLTPNQEKGLDELWVNKGLVEAADGPAIRLADNLGLERAKKEIPAEYLPVIYGVIDEILKSLGIEP